VTVRSKKRKGLAFPMIFQDGCVKVAFSRRLSSLFSAVPTESIKDIGFSEISWWQFFGPVAVDPDSILDVIWWLRVLLGWFLCNPHEQEGLVSPNA
jgi:hypothetical protein